MSKYLPAFLRAHLAHRGTLRHAFDNSFWLLCDQLLRMLAGLIVGAWLARYLGPSDYGWFNYALVTVGVISSLTSPAISAVIVRELARSPSDTAIWMGSAFFLRGVGAALGLLVCVGVAWWHRGSGTPTASLVLIAAMGLLLQAVDVVDWLFQARAEHVVSAKVRIGVCVCGSVLRVGLILGDAPLLAFAAAGVAELAIAAGGWLWLAKRHGQGVSRWTCDRARVVALLRETWPLAVSGIAIMIQAYADQIIIGALIGSAELGQYAAALRIISMFALIPMVIQSVAAPEITRAKRDNEVLYRRRLHSVYRLMFVLFVITALGLIVLGPLAARLLFGASYAGAAMLLPWLAFRLFFTNFGVARSLFITNEGLFSFALYTSTVGAIVNLLCNFLFVPRWGAQGAILASFVSFGISTFALEIFHEKARSNLRSMVQAILSPWRRFAG